jgi:integrase
MLRQNLVTPVRTMTDGRFGFDEYFTTGKRRQVRRLTESAASEAFTDLKVLIANGRKDLVDIDAGDWAEFRKWRERTAQSPSVSEAVKQFLGSKRNTRQKWLRVIRDYLTLFEREFGEIRLADLTKPQITKFLDNQMVAPRTWNNMRGPIVQLFRWAREERLLPDQTTEAERILPLKIRKTRTITHWEPEELQTILQAASDEDRVWYLLGSFAGIRTEELMPEYKDKDPVRWEDFDWTERVIHLRMETSKVNEARNVPISRQLADWLQPYRAKHGPCIPIGRRPRVITRHIEKLTKIKHRSNANRHSYGIYRRMEVKNIERVAEEMGTSIYNVKGRYSRPKNPSELKKWKSILPVSDRKVIQIGEQCACGQLRQKTTSAPELALRSR